MSSLCVVSCDQRVVKQRIFLNKNEIVYDKRLQCISPTLYVGTSLQYKNSLFSHQFHAGMTLIY